MSHLVTVIRENVEALASSPEVEFGHGEESYENLQGDHEDLQDADTAWLHPYLVIPSFSSNGNLLHDYRLLMHFGRQSDLSDDTAILETYIAAMEDLVNEFLIRLENDPRVAGRQPNTTGIDNIRAAPIYFTQDLNLTGYALEFDLQLDDEQFDYCALEPIPKSKCDVPLLDCTELEDLTEGQHACIIPNIDNDVLNDNLTEDQINAILNANNPQVYPYTIPTGQSVIGRTGDDAWIEANVIEPLRRKGRINNLVDFWNLQENNAFGNKQRFTDKLGGDDFTGNDNYMIDHFTGLGWDTRNPNSVRVNLSWNDAIDAALADTHAGFTDWFMPSKPQLDSIMNWRTIYVFSWPSAAIIGYNRALTYNSNSVYWSGTRDNSTTSQIVTGRRGGRWLERSKTTNALWHICRVHYANP